MSVDENRLTPLSETGIFISMSTQSKTLAEAGEYTFIEHIRRNMPPEGGGIIRSIGDDCMITEPSGADEVVLHTIDTFVEDVHFKRSFAPFDSIGRRCMSASVSDIAAMAGIPVYSLVSLSMPADLAFDDAIALFTGLQETANRYGCPITGGETTSTPGPVTITVTVIGRAAKGTAVTRQGARPGDSLYVSGCLGDAMAGLAVCEKGMKGYDRLRLKFLEPDARVALARMLAERFTPTAMIDLSDGLATDIGNICRESGCGARIESQSLPFSDAYRAFAESQGIDPVMFALQSGEDFELLFTVDETVGKPLPDSAAIEGVTITRIGRITGRADGIKLSLPDGSVETVSGKGYEHFTV